MASSYATSDQLLARAPSLSSFDEDELTSVIEAASRWVDGFCNRRFWLDPVATDRVFKACDLYVLDLGEHEIGSSSGVIVKVDDGSGLFATTLSASSYQLQPVNAAYSSTGARPYTTLRAISTTWPVAYPTDGRQDLVKVTAKFGWPSVPPAVREACMTLAMYEAENPTRVRSESIDGYSVSYAGRTLVDAVGGDAAITRKLLPYRRAWAA